MTAQVAERIGVGAGHRRDLHACAEENRETDDESRNQLGVIHLRPMATGAMGLAAATRATGGLVAP